MFIILTPAANDADQGKGKAIAIGSSDVTSLQISSIALMFGRTLKGSIFGGLRAKTDLPLVIEKWKNKVNNQKAVCIRSNLNYVAHDTSAFVVSNTCVSVAILEYAEK